MQVDKFTSVNTGLWLCTQFTRLCKLLTVYKIINNNLPNYQLLTTLSNDKNIRYLYNIPITNDLRYII